MSSSNGYVATNGVVSNGNVKNDKFGPPAKPGLINEKLPKEILLMIFGYLDITTLCRCSQVCKFWYEIAFDGSNWKEINLFDFQIDINSTVVAKIAEISGRFLRELRMKGCVHISDKDIKNLAEKCPLIEDLTLSECVKLTNENIINLTKLCKNLTSLFIDSCDRINDEGVKNIGNCPGMSKLDLSFCDISDEALKAIAHGCPKLTFLRLKGCRRVTSQGIMEIARNCHQLRLLNCNYVTELTDQALALLSQYCPELETLCVSHSAITDNGLKALAGNLCAFNLDPLPAAPPSSSAQTVVAPTSTSSTSILPAPEGDVSRGSSIQDVTIGGAAATTGGGGSGSNAAATTPTNKTNLIYQPTSPQQFGCRELVVLEISSCRITDTGITHIAGACTRLERLDLEDCGAVTDASLAHLAVHCRRLRILLLSHCDQITDRGVQKLVETLGGGCRQLEYLALDNCPLLTDEALHALAKNCVALRKLDLYDCQLITKQAIQRLSNGNEDLVIQTYFAPNTPEGAAGQRRRKVCRCCIIS